MIGYIGTYTQNSLGKGTPSGRAQGIYAFDFDEISSEVKNIWIAAECVNPEFLAFSPSKQFLYTTNEINEFQRELSGAVSAFAVEDDGNLRFINQVSSKGRSPCHISIDPSGAFAFVSNYMEGNLAVLPIKTDGWLDECVQIIQFDGKSVNTERQESPHAHFFCLNGDFGLACDLGSDKIWAFSFDETAEKPLSPLNPPFFSTKAGAGPRHIVFHPSKNIFYVANELDSTVTAFSYTEKSFFPLTSLQTESTLPQGWDAPNTASAIKLSGDLLYISNRGADSIAVFQVDEAGGILPAHAFIPTGGKTPRDFTLDLAGNFIFACHQDSDNLTVFRKKNEKMIKTDEKEIFSGVCVLLGERKENKERIILKSGCVNLVSYTVNGVDQSYKIKSIIIKESEKSKNIIYYRIDITYNTGEHEFIYFIIDNTEVVDEIIKCELLQFMFIDSKERIYADFDIDENLEIHPQNNLVKFDLKYRDQETRDFYERIICWENKIIK